MVIATGGKSYAPLGSDGKGYEIAQSLGHTIITPRPALTDVRLRENPYKPISGVSVQNAELTLWRQNNKLTQYVGALLFTHKGISGPVIINTS